jgi:3-phosphoshikimate 1-carboxyvinyltransferase
VVLQGQEPSALSYRVEGDASGATYFLAAAAVTGKTVRVGPLPVDSRQGDLGFAKVLERMGCRTRHFGECVEVSGGPLSGIEVDLNAMSDTAQTLAAVALFADGPTTIRNIANARIKETDRIAALCAELTRLGAEVEEFADGLTIHPAPSYHPAEIETYDDHRMAMSFTVAALGIPGLVLRNPACVTKTFPDFFEVFAPWADAVSMD